MPKIKLGWVITALLLSLTAGAAEPPVFYAAGSNGIAVVKAEKNTWRQTAFLPVKRPMYLAVSPDGKTLAAALAAKSIRFFEINPEQELIFIKDAASGGQTCCHVSYSFSGNTLYAANYTGGNLAALDAGGKLHLLKHTSSGKVKPHPHYAAMTPDEKKLAVCDLGLDKIFLYPLQNEIPDPGAAMEIKLPAASGPRHLLFSADGNFIYIANELNSTLCVFRKNASHWQLQQTLPASSGSSCRNYPGAIRFSENRRFILVSNRGADTIAVFAVETNGLLKKRQEAAAAPYPSDLLQFGKTLVVACRKGNCVEIRDFNPDTGEISARCRIIELEGAHALAKQAENRIK